MHTPLYTRPRSAVVTCLTADPGVANLIPACFNTFVDIDHAIISTIFPLPSADSRIVVVSYKQTYEHEVVVDRLDNFVQEKSVIR